MTASATVELTDLKLETSIGVYGAGDVVPRAHILDLRLDIDPAKVLIPRDEMELVFDYDPLIARIDAVARDGLYLTQERLMTRILGICAQYSEINGATIALRKTPVLGDSGVLGMQVVADAQTLESLRGENAQV